MTAGGFPGGLKVLNTGKLLPGIYHVHINGELVEVFVKVTDPPTQTIEGVAVKVTVGACA